MAQTVPGSIAEAGSTVVRDEVEAADSATLSDVNFPPENATQCAGWKRVLIDLTFDGGTAPTGTIVPLSRVGDRWVAGAATAAITAGVGAVVEVCGRLTAFRISALTGDPDSVTVHCAGWEPFRYDGPRR
jgi:hypothetical protein